MTAGRCACACACGFGFGHSQPAALRFAALWIPRAATQAVRVATCNAARGARHAARNALTTRCAAPAGLDPELRTVGRHARGHQALVDVDGRCVLGTDITPTPPYPYSAPCCVPATPQYGAVPPQHPSGNALGLRSAVPLADSRARSPRSYRSGDRACLTPSFMRLRAAVPAVPAAARKALRDPPVQRPRLSFPNGCRAGAHPCRERPARDDAVRRHALHARVLHAAVVQAHAAHRQDALDTGLQADRLRQPLPLPVLRLRHRPSAPRPV